MAARVLVSDDLSPEAVRILERAGLEVDVKVGLAPARGLGVALAVLFSVPFYFPQVPLGAAVLSLRHNQPELAVRILEEAQPRFAGNAALPRTLGMALYRQGDFKTSQIALQQAIALDKSCALSYLLMGCTLTRLGQTEAAEGYFRQAQLLEDVGNAFEGAMPLQAQQ